MELVTPECINGNLFPRNIFYDGKWSFRFAKMNLHGMNDHVKFVAVNVVNNLQPSLHSKLK